MLDFANSLGCFVIYFLAVPSQGLPGYRVSGQRVRTAWIEVEKWYRPGWDGMRSGTDEAGKRERTF